MALIQVTPDLLIGKSNELRGLKAQHDEAMSKMRALILGLNEIWKGEAQDALVAKYESNTIITFICLLLLTIV